MVITSATDGAGCRQSRQPSASLHREVRALRYRGLEGAEAERRDSWGADERALREDQHRQAVPKRRRDALGIGHAL
jgi:hypothetical protein